MIYVYALIDPVKKPKPDLPGLEQMPIEIVDAGAIAAICTHHRGNVEPDAENLWRHEAVIEAYMRDEQIALLPARFATTFPAESDLSQVLSEHQAAIVTALEGVRGCVELGVRISSHAPRAVLAPPISAKDGRQYMLDRLAAERELRGVTEQVATVLKELKRVLDPLARAVVESVPPLSALPISAAYLVARGRINEFVERFREIAATHNSFDLLCTGPWPAYHFAPKLFTAEALHA